MVRNSAGGSYAKKWRGSWLGSSEQTGRGSQVLCLLSCVSPFRRIGDRSTTCTLAVAEELYGGNNTEGVILGTRYIFPPAFRHHPLVDKAFEIMTYCARHRPLADHLHEYIPVCATIEPMINCFRYACCFSLQQNVQAVQTTGTTEMATNRGESSVVLLVSALSTS